MAAGSRVPALTGGRGVTQASHVSAVVAGECLSREDLTAVQYNRFLTEGGRGGPHLGKTGPDNFLWARIHLKTAAPDLKIDLFSRKYVTMLLFAKKNPQK